MGILCSSRFRPLVGFSLVLAAFGFSGCAKHAQSSGPVGNIFRYALTTEPTTFDPVEVQDVPTEDLLQNVYEGLVRETATNTLEPALASSWTLSADGRTYTFKIRPGVKFHSGKVVTADDVVYSLTREFDPKLASPVAISYLGDIVGAADVSSGKTTVLSGVKAIDPSTVSITIKEPKAYWINVLTYPCAYILNKDAVDKDPNGSVTANNEDGTGPFRIASYIRGQSVDLTAFPGYWDGAPKIAGIHRPIIVNANTRHNLFLTGQLDTVDLSAGQLQHDETDPVLSKEITFFARATTEYIYLNQKAYAPFKDVRVRQAIAYAIDKASLVKLVYDNHRDPAYDMLPEGIVGFDPQFKGIQFDPVKAKTLLAEAGYPGGKGLPVLQIFYGEGHPDTEKAVDILRQMLSENLGITVQPRQTEFATLIQMEDNGACPALVLGWSADYLDPQDYYSLLFGSTSFQNHTGYANKVYDALCDRADVEQNQQKRIALYRQAAAIVVSDAPAVPLWYGKDPELIRPYVHNLSDSLMGHLPYSHLTLGP